MIRNIVERQIGGDKKYIEAAGLSTDTKPTDGIITGSMFLEVDTGGVHGFDEVASKWSRIGGTSIDVQPLTVTENGVVTAPEGKAYSPVTVEVQGVKKTVIFMDYDGTIVASYSAAEFAKLDEMPENPDHTDDGLTAQGWNWSLANAKTFVAAYGALEIGQMYITTDGKTHVHIHLEAGRTSPMLGVCPNGTVDVDWGDGTAHDTLTGTTLMSPLWTPTHNYAEPGDYVIKLEVSSGGSMALFGNSWTNQLSGLLRYSSTGDARNYVYNNAIRSVHIGNGVTTIGSNTFFFCDGLESVTIPVGVTSISDNAFQNCYSLKSVTLPTSMTSIGAYAFYYDYSLKSVALPYGLTNIGSSAFYACYALASVTIPNSVTTIGGSAFYYDYSLESVTIPVSVTNLGTYVFYYCYSLTDVTIPGSISSIGDNTFQNCYSLKSVTISSGVTTLGNYVFSTCYSLRDITIPATVTSIGSGTFTNCYNLTNITIPDNATIVVAYTFQNCYSLKSVKLPDGVTSIGNYAFTGCDCITNLTIPDSVTSIQTYAFQNCYSLTSITIPSGVTSIGNSAFNNCYGVAAIHIQATTPPTLGSSTFSGIPADCKIYVPAESVDTYKGASGWSTYASYIQAEPA